MEVPFSLLGEQEKEYIDIMFWHGFLYDIAEKSSVLLALHVHNFHSCGSEPHQNREASGPPRL